jgi:membrane-bound ClpP family serine protease
MDVRVPIGGLFTVLGLIIAVYGFATAGDAQQYARSLSVNVNLWWGIVMFIFGLALLGLARRR